MTMDSEKDVHICLQCNTTIKGLMAYVEHRQSNCSTSDDPDGMGDGAIALIDGMVSDEEYPQAVEASQGERHSTRRGRKQKQPAQLQSPVKGVKVPAAQRTPKKQDLQKTRKEPDEALDVSCTELLATSQFPVPGSPRRSSRKGIRISYADLHSGIDRSESKKSDGKKTVVPRGSRTASPGKRKVSRTIAQVEPRAVEPRGRGKKGRKVIEEKPKEKLKLGARVKQRAARERNRLKIKVGKKNKDTPKTKTEMVNMADSDGIDCEPSRVVGSPLPHSATSITEEVNEESIENGDSDDYSPSNEVESGEDEGEVIYIKDGKFYCNICKIFCLTKKKIEMHCATRKHAKKARERGLQIPGAEVEKETADEDMLESEIYQCEICNYQTKKVKMMQRHLRSISHAEKTNVDLFHCARCHRKYKTVDELEAHKVTHSIPTCKKCKITFETAELLEEHVDAENHRVEFRCADCDRTFSCKGNLTAHERCHDPDKQFKCELCPYSATQMADLKKHMYRHQGIKPYKCGLCDYESLTRNGVDRHMKTHMIRTRDFKCDECESAFYDEYLLKQHKYMKHNPERRFPCDFEGCTFAFKYRSSLLTHQRMHTQEKPFLCAECGYATSTKYSLTKHIRLHTGEKPFRCSYPNCSYASRLSTHLSRHKIIHTGAKPFKCPICSYSCNNKQNLRKHLLCTKAHSGVKMYKCKVCADFSTNAFREYVIHVRKEHANEDEYISYFQVAESVNNRGEVQEDSSELSDENICREDEGVSIFDDADMQSFSVVTVIPGRDGMQEQRVTLLDDREEVQKKLEQVILALEDNGTEDEANAAEQLRAAIPIQVNSVEEFINIAAEGIQIEHVGETVMIVPEVQAETEISTTEVPTATIMVQVDRSSRLVSEEDMAAATWLHDMQNVQSVAVETIVEEVPTAEEEMCTVVNC